MRHRNQPADTDDVLQDVSLDIGEGEMVAIVGPSGSGKSTFLQILGGLSQPTSGVVCFREAQIGGKISVRDWCARRGYVFQSYHLVQALTAEENVQLALPGGACRTKARALLDRVGVGHLSGRFPAELSGGQQQRVAIARALVAGEVILLDEPTGALDRASGAAIEALLHELNREHGVTLVMVTHDDGIAARCGRLVRMVDGRIVFDTRVSA